MKLLATLAAAVLAVVSSAAHAQATRTWVSGVGDDANPCSRTAPCKTFAGAISKTAVGGEISVLDPAGFNGVTITKAITIDGAGQLSGILAAGITGVIINTTGAVTLRNLTITSPGSGLAAIRHVSSGPLHLKNVRINMMGGGAFAAIHVAPTAATDLTFSDVTITNCTSPLSGIKLDGAAGAIRATLENVQVSKCGIGLELLANAKAVVRNGNLSHNTTGASVVTAGTASSLSFDQSTISFNGTGLLVDGANASARLSDTTLQDDNTTVCTKNNAGVIVSYGNNRIGAACTVSTAALR
ncbi:MAG: right-handed parallel beta-helix repeat-containing protein [Burkholderiales bacterium]